MNTLHLCSSLLKGAIQTVRVTVIQRSSAIVLQCHSYTCAWEHSVHLSRSVMMCDIAPFNNHSLLCCWHQTVWRTFHCSLTTCVLWCAAVMDVNHMCISLTAMVHCCHANIHLFSPPARCVSLPRPVTALKKLPFMRNRSKEKDREKAVYRRSMCKTSDSPQPSCSSLTVHLLSFIIIRYFTHMHCPHSHLTNTVAATGCHGY